MKQKKRITKDEKKTKNDGKNPPRETEKQRWTPNENSRKNLLLLWYIFMVATWKSYTIALCLCSTSSSSYCIVYSLKIGIRRLKKRTEVISIHKNKIKIEKQAHFKARADNCVLSFCVIGFYLDKHAQTLKNRNISIERWFLYNFSDAKNLEIPKFIDKKNL